MAVSHLIIASAAPSLCAFLVWRRSVLTVSLRWCWTALVLDMSYGLTLGGVLRVRWVGYTFYTRGVANSVFADAMQVHG